MNLKLEDKVLYFNIKHSTYYLLLFIFLFYVEIINSKVSMKGGYKINEKGCVIKLEKRTSYDDHIVNMNFLAEIQKHLGSDYYEKFVLSTHHPSSNSENLFNLNTGDNKFNLLQKKIKKKTKLNQISFDNQQGANTSNMTKVIPLKNFKNTQYIGNIYIGHPEQKIPVIFDTGSGNLWVTSALCSSASCKKNIQYDRKISLNFNRIGLGVEVTFGTGIVAGEINEDTFKLGSINIRHQKFAEILQQTGDVFDAGKFSGILGLGYPEMAAYKMLPVFDTIIADKLLKQNVMAFYFSLNEDTEGEVTFGFVNPKRFEGEISYYKVTDKYYWTIDLDDILYNGKSLGLCKNGCKAIADTGTTLLTGPTPDVKKLLREIPTESNCSNYESTGSLEFVFSGKKYKLEPNEYISKTTKGNKSTCSALIMPLDVPPPHGSAWILGGTFLQKFYSVYDRDKDRIGFALARHEEDKKSYDD